MSLHCSPAVSVPFNYPPELPIYFAHAWFESIKSVFSGWHVVGLLMTGSGALIFSRSSNIWLPLAPRGSMETRTCTTGRCLSLLCSASFLLRVVRSGLHVKTKIVAFCHCCLPCIDFSPCRHGVRVLFTLSGEVGVFDVSVSLYLLKQPTYQLQPNSSRTSPSLPLLLSLCLSLSLSLAQPQTLLVNLVSSMGLFAVAVLVVDFLMVRVLKHKETYAGFKFMQVDQPTPPPCALCATRCYVLRSCLLFACCVCAACCCF